MRSLRKKTVIFLSLLFFQNLGDLESARAGGIYYEFGGGAGLINGGRSFFGDAAPDNPNFGAALNLMFGKNFARRGQDSLLQLHAAIKSHLITASQNDVSISYLPIYFLLRFETPRFYLGAGGTPFVFRKMSTTEVDGSFAMASGGLAGTGEFGLLWRVVPFFHIALETSAHFAQTPGGLSPKPALTGTIQFRVFLTSDEPSRRRGVDFDGWRYPFGLELFD